MNHAVKNQAVVAKPPREAANVLYEQLALHRLKRIDSRRKPGWLDSGVRVALGAIRALLGLHAQGQLVIQVAPGRYEEPRR